MSVRIQPDASCTLLAPAKVNLCLEVLGRRDDGFHSLRTLFATVRLSDTLQMRATASPHLTLELHGAEHLTKGVATGPENLVVRALDALRKERGVVRGAAIRLLKRIPNQAGLGGGSSDAAAALIAGDRVWNLGCPLERLMKIAAQIGSDVPFFVSAIHRRATAAIGVGRGEELRNVGLPCGLPIVIAKPAQGLSTAEVYKNCRESDYLPKDSESRCDAVASSLLGGDWSRARMTMVNSLEYAASRVSPAVAPIREAFDRVGFQLHQLSGSGSAYFGLAQTWREARVMAARLRSFRFGRVWVTTIGQ